MASARGAVRHELAGLLAAALVDGLAQAVYDHRIGDFGGQSPVVVVSSAGSGRQRMTRQGSQATMYLQVDVFVVYATPDGMWDEADAEDSLDALEAAIAGVVDAQQVTAIWQAVDYVGRSERVDVEIGGVEYCREVIQLRVEVYQ